MPAWIHDRAHHLMEKNPEMPEGQAWALATQQSHSLGKSPKGYGTAEGKRVAKKKFDTPKDDTKAADPGSIGAMGEDMGKHAGIPIFQFNSFRDELIKIANIPLAKMEQALPPRPTGLAEIKSGVSSTPPVPTKPLKGKIPKWTKVHGDSAPSPAIDKKPLAEALPVRN